MRLPAGGERLLDNAHGGRQGPGSLPIGQDDGPAGLPLPLLLRLTRLTSDQAVAIASDLLASLGATHEIGYAHGGFGPASVYVGADGWTRLLPHVTSSAPDTADPRDADVSAARAVLTQLADAIAPSASAGVGDPHTVLVHAGDAANGLPELVAMLDGTGTDGQPSARRELGRIVSSVAGPAPLGKDSGGRASGNGHADASLLPDRRTESWRLAAGGRRRSPRRASTRRMVDVVDLAVGTTRSVIAGSARWALALAVLAVVLLVELTLLRDRINQDIHALFTAGQGSETPSSAPPPPEVSPPAPASAGAVLGVNLRAMGQCVPGAPCEVRVLIQLAPGGGPGELPRGAQPATPHAQPGPAGPPAVQPTEATRTGIGIEQRRVQWAFRVVDACTGWAGDLPGGELAIQPDGRGLAVVDTLSLPPGKALAVMAVTSAPAVAASRPLRVPAAGSC